MYRQKTSRIAQIFARLDAEALEAQNEKLPPADARAMRELLRTTTALQDKVDSALALVRKIQAGGVPSTSLIIPVGRNSLGEK